MLKHQTLLSLSLLLPLMGCSAMAYSSGVYLSRTRVIFPAQEQSTSISINNSSDQAAYLVQSWIEDEKGKKNDDFLLTPPLFLSHSKESIKLRILDMGKPHPKDRESVYWLNVKAIPSADSANDGKNYIQFAILSRIKLFYRPESLQRDDISSEYSKLSATYKEKQLQIHNPTPYYITISDMSACGKEFPTDMIAPFSEVKRPLQCQKAHFTFKYRVINDYGGTTDFFSKTI